jgi:hypothetical protein
VPNFSFKIDINTAVNQQHVYIFYYDAPQRDEFQKENRSLSHLSSTVTTLLPFHPFYKDECPDDRKDVKGSSQYNFLAVLYKNTSTDSRQFDACSLQLRICALPADSRKQKLCYSRDVLSSEPLLLNCTFFGN